jgi:SPP1 family predicted phage head-tail adaptor
MGGVAAGRRDRKITFERAVITQNEYGEDIETWSEAFSEWAYPFYGKANERREAAADRSEMPITFSVLANTNSLSITARDRIRYDGLIWNIEGVAPVSLAEIEITAIAAP